MKDIVNHLERSKKAHAIKSRHVNPIPSKLLLNQLKLYHVTGPTLHVPNRLWHQ